MFRSIRTLRSIPRIKDIALILAKHGFHQLAGYLQAPISARIRRVFSETEALPAVDQPQRLRLVLQDLGPTFIKFGQLLSTRPDLLPENFIREMGKLQDDVERTPIEEILRTVSQDLGGDIGSFFRHFDHEPLASASIGQVHRATTLTGDDVVVKVRKRGLARVVEQDLQVLHLLAEVIGEWQIFQAHDLDGTVTAFERAVRWELDFSHERLNLERLYGALKDDQTVCVPNVYPELSTRRVLTMEFLDGVKFSELAVGDLGPERSEELAEQLVLCVLRQIFDVGVFHADPHPGNLILLSNGKIGLIDFGSVGRCTASMIEDLLLLLYYLIRKDYAQITRIILKVGRPKADVDTQLLTYDVMDSLDQYYGLSMRDIDFSRVLNTLFGISVRYKISLPPQYVVLGRTLMTLEGVVRDIAPKLEILSKLEPFLLNAVRARWAPGRVLKEIEATFGDFVGSLRTVPVHLAEVLKQSAEGRFQINTHLKSTERLERRLEFIGYRVPQAILLAGTLVASALLLTVSGGPDGGFGLSTILGAFGFVAALVLVLWMNVRK